MAQIIEDFIFKYDATSGYTWPLFEELENAFNWQSVTGDSDSMLFTINSHLALRFDNFNSARSSGATTSTGKMYVIVNGNTEQWWSIQGNLLTATRRFRIIIGAAGDVILQVDTGNYGYVPGAGAGLQFGIINVQNTVDDTITGYGLYRPRSAGGLGTNSQSVTFSNPVPSALYTDDTLILIQNGNLQGLNNNPDAKITALIPICGLCSECVSTSAFASIISKPDMQQGYIEMEGVLYYVIGGLFLLERNVGGE